MRFYYSYTVALKGISGFTIDYVPEPGKDQNAVRIDADTTTTIKLPALTETISSPDTLLSDKSYLFIQNNSSFSFELHRGASTISPDNLPDSVINSKETAKYTITPGISSVYKLLIGWEYKEFSGSIDNFEAGHLYIFEFNGSISLVRDIELKLENVNGFAVPQPPASPKVIISNRAITLQWTAVENATAYEIWMATVNDSTSATKYGADVVASLSTTISGLNNGTIYYFWLKAKNNLGTSGFSHVATGKPTASTVKPPDPQTVPSIIAGNGQLTISWQAVDQADFYEIWAWTTNNIQSAIKRGEDVSGLSTVITGLINGTNYYVWIKAKNNIGVSGFSPSAIGKPLGIPGIPTVTSAPNQLLVTWTAVAGADEYEVYYGTGTPTTLAATTTGTTATISGLTKGTTYYVRLRAKNSSGISDYGQIANGIPDYSPGLYRGAEKIGTQNLSSSLTYISTNAVSGDDYFIVLGADESVSPNTLSYSGKTVRITLLGSGSERKVTLNANGSMFTINSSGVTLTLDENITLVGISTNNAPLVRISNGNLIMNDGSKIIDNINNGYQYGGGVSVGSGISSFTMNGGTISGNTTIHSGGGGIASSGNLIINGGTISKNVNKSNNGGGIDIYYGTFTMYGGTIKENSSCFGGGVSVYSTGNENANFLMYGGIISGNTSKDRGGGVYSYNGIFKKLPSSGVQNCGIIYGAEAVGIDSDGVPLKNTSSNNIGHSVYGSIQRNTTVGETDQIDTTTGKGLSANGNPPFGQ